MARNQRLMGKKGLLYLFSIHEHSLCRYDHSEGAADKFAVKPWFVSPYTGQRVYFIICPSHQVYKVWFLHIIMVHKLMLSTNLQLKSMVAALYQSRPSKGGTRQFTHRSERFGWEVIVDLYKRETDRKKTGQCVRVPKLKANHVYRDAWTRLNVLPSKVMQVSNHKKVLYIVNFFLVFISLLRHTGNVASLV